MLQRGHDFLRVKWVGEYHIRVECASSEVFLTVNPVIDLLIFLFSFFSSVPFPYARNFGVWRLLDLVVKGKEVPYASSSPSPSFYTPDVQRTNQS